MTAREIKLSVREIRFRWKKHATCCGSSSVYMPYSFLKEKQKQNLIVVLKEFVSCWKTFMSKPSDATSPYLADRSSATYWTNTAVSFLISFNFRWKITHFWLKKCFASWSILKRVLGSGKEIESYRSMFSSIVSDMSWRLIFFFFCFLSFSADKIIITLMSLN